MLAKEEEEVEVEKEEEEKEEGVAMEEDVDPAGGEGASTREEAVGGEVGQSSSSSSSISCDYANLLHSIDDVVDDGSVVMHYTLFPSSSRENNDGWLCVRLEVDLDDDDDLLDVANVGGKGGTWVGLAISPDGRMDGSRAVVGTLVVPGEGGDEEEDESDVAAVAVASNTIGTVSKYELGSTQWTGFASRMDEDTQTLIDASIYVEEYDDDDDDSDIIVVVDGMEDVGQRQQRPVDDEDVDDDGITIVIGDDEVGDDIGSSTTTTTITNSKWRKRRIVMTFGKLLIEDDGWDEYDLPIYETGNNYFLFARGGYDASDHDSDSGGGGGGDGGNALGYHAVRATFVKDFDDDVTDVSFFFFTRRIVPLPLPLPCLPSVPPVLENMVCADTTAGGMRRAHGG